MFSFDLGLQRRRRAAACSIRAASAARRRAPTICRRRRRLHGRAAADEDPRRGQADRARRQVFVWRAARGHAATKTRDRRQRRASHAQAGRAADELLRRPRAARVRQSVVGRLHDDGDDAATAPSDAAVPAGSRRSPAASTGTARLKKRYASPGYLAGSSVHGDADAIERSAGEHRPLLPAPRRGITSRSIRRARRSTARRAHRRSEDRRPARALQLQRRLQVARASTSTTSASCAAPTSGG